MVDSSPPSRRYLTYITLLLLSALLIHHPEKSIDKPLVQNGETSRWHFSEARSGKPS